MSKLKQNLAIPKWFLPTAILGLLWNLFGIYQFFSTFNANVANLISSGLTREQAEMYVNLPVWMNAAFAIGVFGGTIGSVLLALRMSLAKLVFTASLIAYVILYVGDIILGVFSAFGMAQVIILSCVLAIAVGLLWMAVRYLHAVGD